MSAAAGGTSALALIAEGCAVLFALEAGVAVAAWIVLAATARAPRLRSAVLLALLPPYYVALWRLVDARTVLAMGVLFCWAHLGFAFRYLSSVYHYRSGAPAPTLPFHVATLLVGARQHYGAGSLAEMRPLPGGVAFLRGIAPYAAYSLVVAAGFGALLVALWGRPFPGRDLVIPGLVFAVGLEALVLVATVNSIVWGVPGHGEFLYFNRMAWLRSRHVGQFWLNWNVTAVAALKELTAFLGLARRPVLNTFVVFAASGLLHQVMVFYFTRRPSYGTLFSFLVHAALRWLVFNQLTSMLVTMAASWPFVADFYGRFALGG